MLSKYINQKSFVKRVINILFFTVFLTFIAVLGTLYQDRKGAIAYDINLCGKSTNQELCWQNQIDDILKKYGVSVAFDYIDQMYHKDKQFAVSCHGLVHDLGKLAYEEFKSNKDSVFSKKASYCAYGFYHGFMERLIVTSGDMSEARLFCDMAQSKLSEFTNDAKGACYHGIGHGLVEDIPAPSSFGDPQKIIQRGIKICENVSNNDSLLYRCTTGVYNAIEILMTQGKYGLKMDYDNPFGFCMTQPEEYKEGCYAQFAVPLGEIGKRDIEKAIAILDAIDEDEYAIAPFSALVMDRYSSGRVSYDKMILFCRSLAKRYNLPCIYSVGESFLKYGPPEKEYIKAVEFCGYYGLTDEEKAHCFSRILSILRIWYTVEKSESICNSVEKKYQREECNYQ